MAEIKHVGRLKKNNRKVVVAYRVIPGENPPASAARRRRRPGPTPGRPSPPSRPLQARAMRPSTRSRWR